MLEGMTERVLKPRGRNEWLGFDGEDDEKDDDNGLEDLYWYIWKKWMELPFQIEAKNGALSFVDLFTEKENQDEDYAA